MEAYACSVALFLLHCLLHMGYSSLEGVPCINSVEVWALFLQLCQRLSQQSYRYQYSSSIESEQSNLAYRVQQLQLFQ